MVKRTTNLGKIRDAWLTYYGDAEKDIALHCSDGSFSVPDFTQSFGVSHTRHLNTSHLLLPGITRFPVLLRSPFPLLCTSIIQDGQDACSYEEFCYGHVKRELPTFLNPKPINSVHSLQYLFFLSLSYDSSFSTHFVFLPPLLSFMRIYLQQTMHIHLSFLLSFALLSIV